MAKQANTVRSLIPEGHSLDGRYAIERYADGSGFFLNKPRNGRSGFALATAETAEELIRWARRMGAKSAEVI